MASPPDYSPTNRFNSASVSRASMGVILYGIALKMQFPSLSAYTQRVTVAEVAVAVEVVFELPC